MKLPEEDAFFISRRATRLKRERLRRARFWRSLMLVVALLVLAAASWLFLLQRQSCFAPFAAERLTEKALPSPLRSLRNAALQLPPLQAPKGSLIVVHIPSRTLDWSRDGKLIKTYQVAVGRSENPTPVGVFTIFQKEVDPWWYPPKGSAPVPSGPQNPLGYRWLGFAPMYGIHGTNAPWQIGGVVSNGCVRMREADVEELFAAVDYGTPVRIVYELAKVSVEADGLVTAGVYPDVYGRRDKTASVKSLERQLAGIGLEGFLGEAQLAIVLKDGRGRQLPVARLNNVKVNGRLLEYKAVSLQGEVWIPAWPLAAALGYDILYDQATSSVFCNGVLGAAKVKGGVVYISLQTARQLWGGMWLWREKENAWEMAAPGFGS